METAIKTKGFLDFESRKEMTRTEIADMFSEVAESYDEVCTQIEYKLPVYMAETLAGLVDQEKLKHVSILDVAAGTGLFGQELQKNGFTCIDWLDPSDGMKTVASRKNIYRQFFSEFMDGHEIQSIPTGFYDCVAVCGGFNQGLIPCAGITEMIRMTKPGGYVCFAFLDTYIEESPEYASQLASLLVHLQNEGKWKTVEQVSCIGYRKKSCTVHCYQVSEQ